MPAILLLLVGIAFVALGLFMVIPVAVNLPDSWFGALLAILVTAIGVGLIWRGSKGRKSQ